MFNRAEALACTHVLSWASLAADLCSNAGSWANQYTVCVALRFLSAAAVYMACVLNHRLERGK